MREIKEETGYIVDSVENRIGIIIEKNEDKYDPGSIFEMTSHYYLCKITDRQTFQQLDDYEKELDLYPYWVNIDKAIYSNEKILKEGPSDMNPWLCRETKVLKVLKDLV